MVSLISITKAKKMLGVTAQTLRNWDRSGKLKPVVIGNYGNRYYDISQIDNLSGATKKDKLVLGYCRVSSQKQKADLERQIENVRSYLCAKGYKFEIITDIGSGINYNKNGLHTLIDKINDGIVSKIIVLYKDRLLRFGFELIEYFAKINNCEIEIIDHTKRTEEQELVEDLVQIITVFSCKLQGKRSKKTKELIEELLKNDNSGAINNNKINNKKKP
ncbi:MAG: IS607 family transposase [Bacteroidales bacterium]|nr:IS607 family transposase [Bacteroidales bacterium]